MEQSMFDDIRHEMWNQIAKELYRRTIAEEAPEAIFDWISNRIKKLQPETTTNDITTWTDSFKIHSAEIIRRQELGNLPAEQRNLFNWPWQSWNDLIDPAEGGMLVVIAGPDGSGKSSCAECIAEHWARNSNKVAFVHFELSKLIMFDRRAARNTSIARRKLKLAEELTSIDLANLDEMKRRLLDWPGQITYFHTPGKTIELVLLQLNKAVEKGICDVVIIDYLEKSAASAAQLKEFGSNMFAREAKDVELLKNWSEENKIPVVVLSQFNKAGKHSGFGELDRTMIRGAGEKTEKANVVILLQPEKDQDGIINVKVDKNTLGPTGSFQQFFNKPAFSIGDVAK
jgi:replicative DNA helicase